MRKLATRLLPILLFALAASPARAQNILVNSNFNTDVSSWGLVSGAAGSTLTWQALDADGSPASGSALITHATPIAGNQAIVVQQCRPASAGTAYDFGGKVRAASGQSTTGLSAVFLTFYSSVNCSTGQLSNLSTATIAVPVDTWQGSSSRATAPAGTLGVSIALFVSKAVATSTFKVFFDDAFVAPAGSLRAVLTVPVAASIHGANGTFFHSDLWILNRSFSNSTPVILVYRCFGGVGCGSSQTVVLAARESRLISDIVGTLFAVPESGGAIELSWDTFNGPITAQTRLYTPSTPPTFGFGVPALVSSAAVPRAVFVGISGSGGDLTKGFRSNAGVYNPNAVPVTVTFTVVDGTNGTVLGTPFTRVWGPFEAAQVSNLLSSVGATAFVTNNAVLVAAATGGSVFFYANTVDNASGDTFSITASPDEAPVP